MKQEHYTNLTDAHIAYESAKARGNGIAGAKETLKNLLFNYAQEIIDDLGGQQALHYKIADLEAEVEALNGALDEADKELADMKAKAGKKNK